MHPPKMTIVHFLIILLWESQLPRILDNRETGCGVLTREVWNYGGRTEPFIERIGDFDGRSEATESERYEMKWLK